MLTRVVGGGGVSGPARSPFLEELCQLDGAACNSLNSLEERLRARAVQGHRWQKSYSEDDGLYGHVDDGHIDFHIRIRLWPLLESLYIYIGSISFRLTSNIDSVSNPCSFPAYRFDESLLQPMFENTRKQP